MLDIINYLSWISKEVINFKKMPWLGMTSLKSVHQPDLNAGEGLYYTYCADCHGDDGQGSFKVPPLWGRSSFNDGAGMSQLSTLSEFIYWNMPFQDAFLTESQAIDIASFILQQPRPHFQ